MTGGQNRRIVLHADKSALTPRRVPLRIFFSRRWPFVGSPTPRPYSFCSALFIYREIITHRRWRFVANLVFSHYYRVDLDYYTILGVRLLHNPIILLLFVIILKLLLK